jgi:DNA polymerase-3 subunit alpha
MIDPIKWGLLFERFLLPERGGLEPDDVTKMQPEVTAHDYVELTLENGRTYKFDYDAQFRVKRGDDMIEVYADELQEGDDIIWDRKDELFTINEK